MFGKNKGKTENKKRESNIITSESLCATSMLFSFLALLVLCTKSIIFGETGREIHVFLLGVFGYLAYPLFTAILYMSTMGLLGKKIVASKKRAACIVLLSFSLGFLLQTIMTYSWGLDGYTKKCMLAGKTFPNSTVLGAVGGFIICKLATLISMPGVVACFAVTTAFLIFGLITFAKKSAVKETAGEKAEKQTRKAKKVSTTQEQKVTEKEPEYTPTTSQRPSVILSNDIAPRPYGVVGVQEQTQDAPVSNRDFLFGSSPAENYQRNLIFDRNARVNQRPMDHGTPPSMPERESVYMPSYSDSYEETLNAQQPSTPLFVSRTPTNDAYSPYSAQPTQPIETSTSSFEEERSYSRDSYDEPTPSVYADNRVNVREEYSGYDYDRTTTSYEESTRTEDAENVASTEEESYQRHKYMGLFSTSNPRVFGEENTSIHEIDSDEVSICGEYEDRYEDRTSSVDERTSRYEERTSCYDEERFETRDSEGRGGRDGASLLDDSSDDLYTLSTDYDAGTRYERDVAEDRGWGAEIREPIIEERGRENYGYSVEPATPQMQVPKPVEPPKPRVIKPYKRVPLDDFDCRDIEPTSNQEEVEFTKEKILATLEEFKITGATIASVTFGPTVTRYNVSIPLSISPKKVVALDQSIAIGLHSSGVNIYPNYDEGVVSIEVPNKERQFVQLGCMLSGDTFVNAKPSSIMFTMGKDVANRKIYGDISKMIHLLVAGSSGSGKSVFLGSLIVSLIYKYSPEELRLILIDPKKTEFVLYNDLPHLMINEIITDAGKAVQSLNWAIGEMNRRYGLFEQMSRAGTYVVNLDQYNEKIEKAQRLPKIVIIIDELADLMLAAKKDMEDRIQNLTQKARAAGIHLIVATQRPSTDVITGVIKSNLPTRVAFYVATDVDSRVILDQTGAQKLLGKGDLLYTMPGLNTPVRVQSAFISPEDSQRVVSYIKNNNEAYYDEEATAYINSRGGNGGTPSDPFDVGGGGDTVDQVYIEALRYVILSNSASISMIQRKCSAGYNRAGKIIEWMEDMGYISPFDGAKARKVLITKEEFESKYGPLEK